jgi:hypothetical protein
MHHEAQVFFSFWDGRGVLKIFYISMFPMSFHQMYIKLSIMCSHEVLNVVTPHS